MTKFTYSAQCDCGVWVHAVSEEGLERACRDHAAFVHGNTEIERIDLGRIDDWNEATARTALLHQQLKSRRNVQH